MLKIAICDDDQRICNSIEDILEDVNLAGYSFDSFQDGRELLGYLDINDESYNLYFLDIEMPGMSGIELAKAIRAGDRNALIIFVTSYKEYVYDVFEVLPFRFLCKPLEKEAVKKAVFDAAEHIRRESAIFFFHIGHEKYQIPYKEIMYVEGAGRKVLLHTSDKVWEFYGRISKIADSLDRSLFVRIHGSYIVNMEQIRGIRTEEVELQNKKSLPVSRSYSAEVKRIHLEFLRQRGGV